MNKPHTDTPKTYAEINWASEYDPDCEVVSAELSIKLEKELAAVTKQRDALAKALVKCKNETLHEIPYYAYGDQEAACVMDKKLDLIAEIAQTDAITNSDGSVSKLCIEYMQLCEHLEQRDTLAEAIRKHKRDVWPLTGEKADNELWQTLATLQQNIND